MTTVRQPRKLDAALGEVCRLRPTALQLTLNLKGTSTAQMTLAEDDAALAVHDFVELYTARGSAGVFRVTSLPDEVATSRAVTLMHGIDTLSDGLWKAQLDYDGTVRDFLTKLLAQQPVKRWKLGTVDDTAKYKRAGINYDRLSDLFNALCEERIGFYPVYDFSTTPWTLSFRKLPTAASAEFRLTRNVERCRITRDDGEQCTRLYLSVSTKKDSGTETTLKTYNHAEAQRIYGIIEKAADIDAEDVPNPDTWAADFLNQRAFPAVQITIDGYELARLTGESFDTMTVGKLCRAVLPKRGSLPAEVLEERIMTVTYPDAVGQPERVTVELANHLAKFSEGLASMERLQRQTQRAARSSARASYTQQQQQTSWSQVVQRYGEVLDETGLTELHESGIVMDADSGVRIYSLFQGDNVSGQGALNVAWDKIEAVVRKTGINKLGEKETLYSKITQAADRISLFVSDDEYEDLEDFLERAGAGSFTEYTRDQVSTIVKKTGINKLTGENETLYSRITQTANSIVLAITGKKSIKSLQDYLEQKGKGHILQITDEGLSSLNGKVTTLNNQWGTFTGTNLYQNREQLGLVAGKMKVTAKGNVKLVDGAQLVVTRNGISGEVGTVAEIRDEIDGKIKKQVTGTDFWQNRDHIGQVAGKFEVTARGNVKLIDGAQMYVTRNKVAMEVCDKGNVLTSINASKEGVKIKAKMVDLGEYATVVDLNATNARIKNLEASIANFGSAFASDTMSAKTLYATNQLSIGSGQYGGSGSLYFQGKQCYWKSVTVVTGITAGVPSTTTIYYVGR